jgi:polyisoprenoid-binding protein YceI
MTATATTPETASWQLDPTHSSVEFAIKHLMIATVKGTFSGLQATLGTDESTPGAAKLEVTIDTKTISTHNEQRDAHLRSADFFDVEKYPTINFVARRMTGDVLGDFQVVGDLSMHGVTKEVTLKGSFEGAVKDPWGNARLGYTARGTLHRSDFGLTWNQALEAGGVVVGDEVKISVEGSFVRK